MKFAPYFIECELKEKRFGKAVLNIDIWLDEAAIKKKRENFTIENTAIDFVISSNGRTCPRVYNLHLHPGTLFDTPGQKKTQLNIKRVSDFICYRLTGLPVIDSLDITRAELRINLFNNFYQGYPFCEGDFYQNVPFKECIARKETYS